MENIELEIYADEIIAPTDFQGKLKNVLCMGCLFVPVQKKSALLKELYDRRCLNKNKHKWDFEYDLCINNKNCKKEWHSGNDCEIHHKEISSSKSRSKKEITKNWLKFIMENGQQKRDLIFFNILYIDLDTLNIDNFGKEKNHENIYNKFFRTAITYGIKSFFSGYNKIIIKKVYHDKGSLESHEYFPELNLKKLDEYLSDNCSIEDTNITFIDSNHKNYDISNELYSGSQLIQFIDLIIGSTTQNICYLSNDELKKECAMIIRPLIKRLLSKPRNIQSSYNYVNRQNISIFPKNKIDHSKDKIQNLFGELFEIDKNDQFYRDINLEMPDYDKKQTNLLSF